MPDALDLLLALEGAELGVWRWEPRTGETSGSARLHELIGVPTALGGVGDAPFEPLLGAEERLGLRRGLEAHWRTRKPYVGVLWATVAGAPRVLRVRGHSVWGRNGEVLRMAGTLEDITVECMEFEELRRRAEVFERARWGMLVGSADFSRIEIVNQAFADERGYSVEELLAMSPREIFAPEVRAAVAEELAAAHARGRHSFESVHMRKDGTRFPVEIDVTAVRDDGGELVHRLVHVQDIRERKEWEERLRRSERMFRGVFDASPIAIFLFDPDGRLTQANPAGLAVFGVRDLAALRGFSLFEVRDVVTPAIRARLDVGESVRLRSTIDFDEMRERGLYDPTRAGVAEIDWVITPLGADGILVQIQDITDRRRAEEDARELEQRLFQAKKMEAIGRLAGGVAHDFNNILAVISTRAELALGSLPAGSDAGRHVEGVLKTAHRSVDLVRQLLSFARRQVTCPKVLDLGEALRSATSMLRELVGPEIDLVVEVDGGLWPVRVDPAQVDQILVNLGVNARDAIAKRGTIWVRARNAERLLPSGDANTVERREGVTLTVRDDGSGIPAEHLDQIFEPFFSTKQARHCVGLGLATVYGIVEQNGGDIRVTSEVGGGTTFEVWLPRHRPRAEAEARRLPSPGHADAVTPRGHGETVLLVEDDRDVLESLREALESLGYRVEAAGSVAAALRIVEAATAPILAVLTDMVMPERSGVWLAEALRERKPELPVIFISGNPSEFAAEREAAGLGGELLSKPVRIGELGEALRRAIGGASSPRSSGGGGGQVAFSPLLDRS